MNRYRTFFRLHIKLNDIEPPIWRELLVPARYSFWDLHVAIQDCMGWQDSHLFDFSLDQNKREASSLFGYPNDMDSTLPAWDYSIADYLCNLGDTVYYEYDFGDDWEHTITLIEIGPRPIGEKYPKCVDGERACPPEDCGGVHGYHELTQALLDPNHDEYESSSEWIPDGWMPELFHPKKVKFRSPTKQLDKYWEATCM